MTENYICAHYVAHLTTPFAIAPDLEALRDSMKFTEAGHAIELKLGLDDRERHIPLGDGTVEPGWVNSLLVEISGQGMASFGEHSDFLQSYEQILIKAVRRFITWVRVKTNQSWLDDRSAIRSYAVRFVQRDGSLSEGSFRMNPIRRRVSLHPDDAYSGLSIDDWTVVNEHFISDDDPPRLERLLVEARALLAVGFHSPALVLVVSALEDLEGMWLEGNQYNETQKKEFIDRKMTTRIKEIALKEGLDVKERRLISKMIAIRHDNIHKTFVDPKERDVMALIHATLKLTRRVKVC